MNPSLPSPHANQPSGTLPSLHDIDVAIDIIEPFNFLPVWISLAILTIALIACYVLRKRGQRILPPPPPIIRPAHEIALDALSQLSLDDPISIYVTLSDIVRHYIEDRFGIRAPEQTTQEFLSDVAKNNHLTNDQITLLKQFLQEADMVKFAKQQVSIEQALNSRDTLTKFIHESTPKQTATTSNTGATP